jgi:hypothetical protein
MIAMISVAMRPPSEGRGGTLITAAPPNSTQQMALTMARRRNRRTCLIDRGTCAGPAVACPALFQTAAS